LEIYDTKPLEIPIRHIPFPSPIEKLMDALLEEAHSTLDIILLEYGGRITINLQE
jgi:hypothetical protein